MASSVLTEISHLLNNLSTHGESAAIDLRSLPLTRADRMDLGELLGRGEIHAELYLAGTSEVWETRYPGVWWIRHQASDGKILSEEIAVTPIPGILVTHVEDIRSAALRLKEDLALFKEDAYPPAHNENHDAEVPDARP